MFEYGTIYGILLLMMYIASIIDIIGIIANTFFRREYRANYAKYGISIFRIIFSILLAVFAIFIISIDKAMSASFRGIHIAAAILLCIDVVSSITFKLFYYLRTKRLGLDPEMKDKK
jgi:hypothetical protein